MSIDPATAADLLHRLPEGAGLRLYCHGADYIAGFVRRGACWFRYQVFVEDNAMWADRRVLAHAEANTWEEAIALAAADDAPPPVIDWLTRVVQFYRCGPIIETPRDPARTTTGTGEETP